MTVPDGWYEHESKKLHIGSGTWYTPGWMNVDVPGHDYGSNGQPDVYANVLDGLPFPDDTFDQIYMGHFLEHLYLQDIPKALAELHRVAEPGCRVAVVGPCMDLALEQNEAEWLIEAIKPHGDPPGGHQWESTGSKTRIILEQNGMIAHKVDISEIRRPEWANPNHTAIWQFAILAKWDE